MPKPFKENTAYNIIESVESISRDERDSPYIQYITNVRIFCAMYTIMYFNPLGVTGIYICTLLLPLTAMGIYICMRNGEYVITALAYFRKF